MSSSSIPNQSSSPKPNESSSSKPNFVSPAGGMSQKEDKTLVFIDVENCLIPSDFDPKNLAPAITKSLKAKGYTGGVEIRIIAANDDRLKKWVREAFRAPDSGVTLKTLGQDHKQASDAEIIFQMLSLLDSPKVPTTILLVSGDTDFTEAMEIMYWAGFNLLLASRPSASTSTDLQSLVRDHWEWRALLNLPESMDEEEKSRRKLERRMEKTRMKKKRKRTNDRHDDGKPTYLLSKKQKKKNKRPPGKKNKRQKLKDKKQEEMNKEKQLEVDTGRSSEEMNKEKQLAVDSGRSSEEMNKEKQFEVDSGSNSDDSEKQFEVNSGNNSDDSGNQFEVGYGSNSAGSSSESD